MKILSIYPYTYISSAALMINGKIVAAAPEERFNRQKMSTEFPVKAINWCLNYANISINDVDLIAIPWNPSININDTSKRWISTLKWRGEFLSHIPAHILRLVNGSPPNETEIILGKQRIIYFNHHECHAASAFFNSPFNTSDILTIDGHGEKETCYLGFGKGKILKKLWSVDYPHSIGLFYGTFTDFLGYQADSDEWKVMALSSFSAKKNKYDKLMKKLIQTNDKGFELNLSYFDYYNFDRRKNLFSKKLIELFGPKREKHQIMQKKHYEIAGALQRTFEEIVFHLLRILKKKGSKSNNIVLAGGAAMNCVFNGKLSLNKIYKKDYVPSYPDDSGVSIGAALLAHNKFSKRKRVILEETNSNFGPEFSNTNIKKVLIKNKIKFKIYKEKELFRVITKKIDENNIVGWFQGKMEFGHRALGNRSIIASPKSNLMKDRINKAIKFRENYRPFAPAELAEHKDKIFKMNKNEKINFMQKALPVKKNWRKKIPAACHVDNTARVQTVYRKDNQRFYDLISEFNKLTKIPVLINTSFNLNGEPIVCSPEDAIRTFYTCGLDILVLGDYVIEK